MTTKSIVFFLTVLVATGCEDNGSAPPAPAQPQANAPSAGQVAYDNAGSRLSDPTVQGALDELAARLDSLPTQESRIEIVTKTKMSEKTQVGDVITAHCPLVGENRGKALGGSCSDEALGVEISLRRTTLFESSYQCFWNKPAGHEAMLIAKVACLLPSQ